MYFLSMGMIQIRAEIRGMWFPEKSSLEKSSIAGSRTKDLTLCRTCLLRIAPRHINIIFALCRYGHKSVVIWDWYQLIYFKICLKKAATNCLFLQRCCLIKWLRNSLETYLFKVMVFCDMMFFSQDQIWFNYYIWFVELFFMHKKVFKMFPWIFYPLSVLNWF